MLRRLRGQAAARVGCLSLTRRGSTPSSGWVSGEYARWVALKAAECLFLQSGSYITALVSLPSIRGMDEHKPCSVREMVRTSSRPGLDVAKPPAFTVRSLERHPFTSSISPSVLGVAVPATTTATPVRLTSMSGIPQTSLAGRNPLDEPLRNRHGLIPGKACNNSQKVKM